MDRPGPAPKGLSRDCIDWERIRERKHEGCQDTLLRPSARARLLTPSARYSRPKFWLDPVEVARNEGFRKPELLEIAGILRKNLPVLNEAWFGRFGRL